MVVLEVWAYSLCGLMALALAWLTLERLLCQHDGCETHEICPVCGRRKE